MKKRTVLVTGGSRGIGRACVDAFQASGDRVVTCARSLESLSEVVTAYQPVCDVSDAAQVNAMINHIAEQWGTIDIVVNNAGIAGANRIDGNPKTRAEDDEAWHRIFGVNVHGTYNVIQSALAYMPDNGRIINIASVLGLRGVPDQPAYCAAKHAVVGLTKSLALRLAPRQITVNAVCPGWVKTEMSAKRAHELAMSTDALGDGVPLGRMALPEEVAALVHYVASDAARMITGQTLTLDGGATA